MMSWAKKTMANVVGTQEPIYGPSAIRSVTEQTKATPYTELTKSDLTWKAMTSTCVETQCFYFTADNGYSGMAQVIYSNVAGIRTTCQFNTKIHYPRAEKKAVLWSSDPLKDVDFSQDKNSFYATDVAVELNAAGDSYTIKSMTNQASIVNLTLTRTAPGFQAGKDGLTHYGTDPQKPWGSMRHAFWPRCKAEGTIMTKDGPIDFKGKGMFIHALQGMKPHHAAAKWNYCNFQGPEYSAALMDFTTPPSYGATVVPVGGIAKDGEMLIGGSDCSVTHTATKSDAQNDWPEPTAIKYTWKGTTKDGKQVEAVLEGPLGERLDKVDVMAEVPGFVKNIVGAAVGTKPYIYQYSPPEPVTLKMKIGDKEVSETGILYAEATFISPTELPAH